MSSRTRSDAPSGGFSMVELLIVAALIVVMAAVALPNIAGFVRQSKIRGAAQQVAGEIQTARNKAIVKNVSPGLRGGVVFAILDANTYRFTVVDENFAQNPPNPVLGASPMRDLPSGVTFVAAAAPQPGGALGFDQLGRRCSLDGTSGIPCPQIPPAQVMATLCPDAAPNNRRCNDYPQGNYLNLVGSDVVVSVREVATQIVRTVVITPGGKVQTQR